MSFIVTPTDIAQEQQRLQAALTATQAQVTACTNIDPVLLTGWNAFYAAASSFCTKSPQTIVWPWDTNAIWATATSSDILVAYEHQLDAWQVKITNAGCKQSAPTFSPYESTPLIGSNTTGLLEVAGIAVAAVAGAYVVKEVIGFASEALSFAPKPKPEKKLPKEK